MKYIKTLRHCFIIVRGLRCLESEAKYINQGEEQNSILKSCLRLTKLGKKPVAMVWMTECAKVKVIGGFLTLIAMTIGS